MKLHELKPATGATAAPRRVGRGVGSGLGKTSGKGHKGAKARSGGGKGRGFEGGQMPLVRRVPIRGFTNHFQKRYAIVNIFDLDAHFESGAKVTAEELRKAGLIKKLYDGVKILGDGDLSKKLSVEAVKFTQSAKEKIESAGGTAIILGGAEKAEVS